LLLLMVFVVVVVVGVGVGVGVGGSGAGGGVCIGLALGLALVWWVVLCGCVGDGLVWLCGCVVVAWGVASRVLLLCRVVVAVATLSRFWLLLV
jgi:hypothetical protein